MSINDFISDVTANLTEWDIDYRETTEGISVGNIHLEIAEYGYRPDGTILNGTEIVAVTSDADKAAALLAFPLARRAWGLDYTGDFEIAVFDGEVEMRLSYGSSDLAISAGIDEADRFTITEHELLAQNVVMSDLEAALTSTELAYDSPDEAWQALCSASDFEGESWEEIVDALSEDAYFYEGDRITKVLSWGTENVVLVEDYNPESPIRVIDVERVIDMTFWAPSDVAAAVLNAIS